MTKYPVKLLKDKDGTAFIPVVNSNSIITPEGDTLDALLDEKQDTLISGTNIKTINNESILGSGNITIQGGGSATDVQINGTSITSSNTANIITKGTYNSSSNKIATENDLPTRVSDLQNDSGFTTNIGTITGVSVNNTSVATSGVANIPAASTSAYGVTKLSDATNSTSTALAATANAVKTTYDLADGKLEKNYTQTQANGEIKWQGGADSTNSELISKVTSNTNNNFSQAEITSDNILLTSGIDGVNARSTVNMTPYAINIANQTTDGSINLSADLITLNGGAQITTTPDTNYSIVNKKYVDDAVGILRDNNAAATVDSNAGNLYRYQICLTNRDGHLIPYNNISNATTTYTKGLSSQPFDPFAPIYYYNSTTTVNAGSNAGAGSLYQHIYFDCRYSMNINSGGTSGATALTPNAPVYLVALYNETTGLATLQGVSTSNNYLDRSSIVQAFPSVEIQSEIANNFYIFIYLGRAGSKYQIELDVNHPVYKWDSTNETYTIFCGGGGSVGPASQTTLGTLRAWADTNTNTLYLSNQEYINPGPVK